MGGTRKSEDLVGNAAAATDLRPVKPERSLRYQIIRGGIIGTLGMFAVGVIAVFIWYRSLFVGMPELPPTEELWTAGREASIEFVDLEGETIAVRGPRYGRAVRVEELADHIPGAFIAAEDKRFYEHDGADTTAILRAAWTNWWSGRTVSGASTLTQQLIKNLILSPEQTYKRKFQEVRLARELEERLTKDEILELYLNRAYFGSSFYGLSAAAEGYFGKPATELSIGEAALLAGIVKAPSRWALNKNLEGALGRRDYVLERMVETGLLTGPEKEVERDKEIVIVEQDFEDPRFGYILDTVKTKIDSVLPSAPGDLIVQITIEPDLQRAATDALIKRMEEEGSEAKATQAAAVIMRSDGRVAALIGGLNYEESSYNRAVQAMRQPGSSFKPFVYAAALQEGTDLYDVRVDEPIEIDNWKPVNYIPDQFLGPVTISEAFATSLNTVAAQLAQEVGEEKVIRLAKNFGIRSDMKPLPSIALGSEVVNLYELTRAYGVFARDGARLDPYFIQRIEDSRGTVLYERQEYEPKSVYPPSLTRKMNAMMARAVQTGTGTGARIDGWTVAGKTGTSQDWRDAWFVGFTSKTVTGVWVGNDDNSPMNEVTGGGLPTRLFRDITALALQDEPRAPLSGAEGIVAPSSAAETRIAFYRNLANAFRTVENHQSARAGGGAQPGSP